MKKSTLLTSLMIILGTTVLAPVQAQEELVYVAVNPCRIVDTRTAGGAIGANTFRNFRVSGTSGELAIQGGTTCLDPMAGTGTKPAAVSAYIVAVPGTTSTSGGVLTAYPSDQPAPPAGFGATVNFAAGQVIGNTSNITLCDPAGCPSDGEFAILARNTNEHVVIDVQGYFYPLSGGDGQNAAGQYAGTGQGIYMDGTTSEITNVTANVIQEGDFIYGQAQYTVTVGANSPVVEGGQLSGHIQGNTIKGLFGGCSGPAPACVGGAIFDGKLTGNELNGTVLDLSDGSTFTLTLQRTGP
jgi:hypothetical protein